MGKIEVKRESTIDATVEELWQVLSGGYTDVGSWASLVNWSKPNPEAIEILDGAPDRRTYLRRAGLRADR